MKSSQIQLKVSNEDKNLLKQASELQSLGLSSFCRMASLNLAREILLQYNLNQQGGAE